ncbi:MULTISPECIES: hypothetical protein [Fusobacterium]|jgi:hypothetical protein|uniref:hypothetical protein n=1 Tax=Fusobacterium TaxID=848 RepID=UPI00044D0368|nr:MULTISPECIES: hypothetical protein [Fusobacterium]EUB36291.1 hypothetical protein HMPREF1501_1319 [Fusobacterium sp. OBRC1]WRL72397.1 hypothetical protein VKN77_08670 [Fusobacterium polymorphum]
MRKVVIDTNVLLDLFEEEEMSFKTLLKSLNIILPTENIDGIIILDSVYSEIEKLKKRVMREDKRTEIAKKVYRLIGEAIEENEIVFYADVERNLDGVDGSLIDYCIDNDELFLSFDTRANIRYRSKIKDKSYININKDKMKKVIKLHEILNTLTDNNLYIYLQKMFDEKMTNIIEYSALNKEARFLKLLDYLVKDILKDEEEEFINKIKEGFELLKEGEITQDVLIKNLKKLNGYKFGDLDVVKRNPLKEEHQKEITYFLKEKGFESFEELSKCNPFLTEEELIQEILAYHKKLKGEMNE